VCIISGLNLFSMLLTDEFSEPERKRMKIYNDINESSSEDNKDDNDDNSNGHNEDNDDDDDEDSPAARFQRGEDLSDDLDLGDNSQDSIGDDEDDDDREWNALGAALEREFLSEWYILMLVFWLSDDSLRMFCVVRKFQVR